MPGLIDVKSRRGRAAIAVAAPSKPAGPKGGPSAMLRQLYGLSSDALHAHASLSSKASRSRYSNS